MVNWAGLLVPALLVTVTSKVPSVAEGPIENVAEICVALTTLTPLMVISDEPVDTVEPDRKPVPVSVTAMFAPGEPEGGAMPVSVGAVGAFKVNVTGPLVPPAVVTVTP
jgi:hypothetical protein